MRFVLPLLFFVGLFATGAHAEVHEVKMLNRNSTGNMVYEPDFVRLKPGDSIRFRAANVSHDSASIPEMLPAGAEAFKGKINEEIEVTFTAPGTYGIKCIPHYGMGMVMLVQVGDEPVDAIAVPERLPPLAKRRFQEILQRAKNPEAGG